MWLSIGGGTSKLIAKLAAEKAKPRPGTDATGVKVVPSGDEAEFMKTLSLAAIPGVGPKLQAKLKSLGLETVAEGIEHEDQVKSLLALGCVAGQGFLFARATSLEAVSATSYVQRRAQLRGSHMTTGGLTATGRYVVPVLRPRSVA